MKNKPLLIPFIFACLGTLAAPIFFPQVRLVTFAPFLALLFLRRSFYASLVISICIGILLDLLSSHLRFGTHALSYAAATCVLYPQRIHFFEDKTLSFCFYSSIIASITTLSQLLLLAVFSRRFTFSFFTFFTDVVVMPIFDGIYAFLWFTCPLLMVIFLKKAWFKLIHSPSNRS